MNANTLFNAKIVIGFDGVAAISVNESTTAGANMKGRDCGRIREDIKEYTAEDWLTGLPLDKPQKTGVYIVSGTAHITDDECEYVSAFITHYSDV